MGAVSSQELLLTLSDVKHGRGQDLSLLLPVLHLQMLEALWKMVVFTLQACAGLTEQMNADVSWEERVLVQEQVGHGARKWLLLLVLHWWLVSLACFILFRPLAFIRPFEVLPDALVPWAFSKLTVFNRVLPEGSLDFSDRQSQGSVDMKAATPDCSGEEAPCITLLCHLCRVFTVSWKGERINKNESHQISSQAAGRLKGRTSCAPRPPICRGFTHPDLSCEPRYRTGQAGGSFAAVFFLFGKGSVVLSNIRQASSCADRWALCSIILNPICLLTS